ncbi:MAG: ATP-binding cassette domain-containing protein [Oscillospiraceae bacterium]|jgi:ABC-type multidrug transport system ATPase subunit/pSer/pThr/pTyr-binding forkhead associated (FHA) protein/ABC-type transport system involved in multi-copper enzyme maturation permease subunit|nr:ATP-binding cassette domain-containing protein [Oscillospiraceae bacterium]
MESDIFNRTTAFKWEMGNVPSGSAVITIFDGSNNPVIIDLHTFGTNTITFGRDESNDVVIRSKYVSRQHGRFRLSGGTCIIENNPNSTNGLIFNNRAINARALEDKDIVRIDDGVETTVDGVLIMFSAGGDVKWKNLSVSGKSVITIGRSKDCDICLDHVSVSQIHAKIEQRGSNFYLSDYGSTNGVMVNGRKVEGRIKLNEKDLILITNSKIIFTSSQISYCCFKSGINVELSKVVKKVGKGKIICNSVDLHIKAGNFIAIVGGSGAGKSTVMNCMSGYSQPTSGTVTVNGINLHENFDAMKTIIGYVPQSDIVYDNLTVFSMLKYAAQLRLPKDTSVEECNNRIEKVIEMVELVERKDTLIKNLSGGQRKRASIAVEMLSDPNLFFLDEPASGLDPGTERNLMKTLRNMADEGKTVIFVTHSTLNLGVCDKVVFMGAGGNLCFCGNLEEAEVFFEVDDVVDVYNLITHDPQKWRKLYDSKNLKNQSKNANQTSENKQSSKKEWFTQTIVLCKRNLHIMLNDRVRLMLILMQAPLLAFLLSLVADGNQFEYFGMTRSLLFALACSAFWLGTLNSIQEVCKERVILKREYMTGVRLDSYIVSKMAVMAIICALQAFMLTGVFAFAVGVPNEKLLFGAFPELLISTFLTSLSASATGIFVSSLFKNADRAMTVAPLLLMPQLLFSGMIFELNGVPRLISNFAVCRWSMEAYGTSSNLNDLEIIVDNPLYRERIENPMYGQEVFNPAIGQYELIDPGAEPTILIDPNAKETMSVFPDFNDAYDFTVNNLISSWAIMFIIIIAFSVAAGLVLRGLKKER